MRRVVAQAAIGVLGVWMGLLMLLKPVHIDDPVVLHVAQNVLKDPLRPFEGEFFWLEEPKALFRTTTNPPLVSYWLAPFIAVGGYREWWLHLSLMPFVVLLAWGMWVLARRWLGESQAWWAVGWMLLSPGVLPGMNLMRDVPAFGLFVGGMACWVEGLHRSDRRWLIAGALLGGLAGLAKYTALYWVGLALLYALWMGQARRLGWLVLALVPIGVWSLHNLAVYGEAHLLYLWQERRGSAPWEAKFLPAVVGIGGGLLLSVAVVGRWLREGWLWRGVLSVGALGALVGWHRLFYADQPFHWQSLIWLVNGGLLLLMALGDRRTDRVALFLKVWVGLGLVVAVWGVPFQGMRHLLFLLPPLVLLLGRYSLRSVGVLGVQGVLCVLVLMADCEYADAYRQFARWAEARWGAERVWYAGSWGWMFYAEQAGFRKVLPNGEGMQAGDWVLIPERVYKGKMPPDASQRLVLVEEHLYRARLPLHTMDAEAGAFYYALIRGRAPFAFTTSPVLERFRVYRWSAPP